MTATVPIEARIAAMEATVAAYKAHYGPLPAEYTTIARVSSGVIAGTVTDRWDEFVVLRAEAAMHPNQQFHGMLGGTWDPETPVQAQAAANTPTVAKELSTLDTRLFDRLDGFSQSMIDRIVTRLDLKLEAAAAKLAKAQDKIHNREGATAIREAYAAANWADMPTEARAALTLEQEALIQRLIEEELPAVDELMGGAQERLRNLLAEAVRVERTALAAVVQPIHDADKLRAVRFFADLVNTTLVNRFTADITVKPTARLASGVLWDSISVLGGADTTPNGGLAVGESGEIMADGQPGRGRYLGQSEKTTRLIEDLEEAETGTRQGYVREYTFRHSGSVGDDRNEVHRRKDGTTWRDGGYRQAMFDERSGTTVAPGQYPGCGCTIESELVPVDQPGPRLITEEDAANLYPQDQQEAA